MFRVPFNNHVGSHEEASLFLCMVASPPWHSASVAVPLRPLTPVPSPRMRPCRHRLHVQQWNLTRVGNYFAEKHRRELQLAAAQRVYDSEIVPAQRRARKDAMLQRRVQDARQRQSFKGSIFATKSHVQKQYEVSGCRPTPWPAPPVRMTSGREGYVYNTSLIPSARGILHVLWAFEHGNSDIYFTGTPANIITGYR